jgi:hypothetical protein
MKNIVYFCLLFCQALIAEEAHYPIHILLTNPRSVSTAFEKSILSRGDYKVLHEPWESAFMVRESILHVFDQLPSEEIVEAKSYEDVKALIYRYAEQSPVFIKDMIWAMPEEFLQDEELLADPNVHITFLVRDPAKSIESYVVKGMQQAPAEETLKLAKLVYRYDALVKIAEKHHKIRGTWPLIIESEYLCLHPKETMETYCQYVGEIFVPEMLAWKAEMHDEWKHYAHWHTDAAKSTGFFVPKRDVSNVRFSGVDEQYREAMEQIYQEQKPFYDVLNEQFSRNAQGRDPAVS